LAFEIVGIERTLLDLLVVADCARLLQQLIDERGLAVVDMGDDGDITNIHDGLREIAVEETGPPAHPNRRRRHARGAALDIGAIAAGQWRFVDAAEQLWTARLPKNCSAEDRQERFSAKSRHKSRGIDRAFNEAARKSSSSTATGASPSTSSVACAGKAA